MSVKFPATYYHSSSEEDVLTVGFADSENDPQSFLILQRAEDPDEQDEELGQDTYYVEIGDPGMAGYGGIDDVSITEEKIIFTYSDTTNWCKKIKTLEINISPQLAAIDDIEVSLREIFTGTPTNLSRP
ncbi:Imm10 family immunity protein [Pectobacterium polaris]|uniref:Imm10 family immunity protein n=1 Tax=Pectobacterium polaris TaxID=2042057 RepID=UPI0024064761|nr:Imm10 family immunity protein [Pectobacterium polaris]MDG0799765.1 Imm10 family immunity protein [Pectobacterium polaris]